MQYPDYAYETGSDPTSETGTYANSDSQLLPLTANPLAPAPTANRQDALALAAALQSIQQTQLQQMYALRGMETRLAQLEQNAWAARGGQNSGASDSFERATWWALWGILMLILGGALMSVIMLILLNAQIL